MNIVIHSKISSVELTLSEFICTQLDMNKHSRLSQHCGIYCVVSVYNRGTGHFCIMVTCPIANLYVDGCVDEQLLFTNESVAMFACVAYVI